MALHKKRLKVPRAVDPQGYHPNPALDNSYAPTPFLFFFFFFFFLPTVSHA